MKLSPRHLHLFIVSALACVTVSSAVAQEHGGCAPSRHAPTTTAKRASDKRAAERAKTQRDARRAVAVLVEMADAARSFDEPAESAEVQSLAADALWPSDAVTARAIFRRAWDAATTSDEAEFKKAHEETRDGSVAEQFTRTRGEVLRTAARRDARLAEAFMHSLEEWLEARLSRESDTEAAIPGRRSLDSWNEMTETGRRLSLASSLLDDDGARSAQIAAPTVNGGVSGALVEFLLQLRVRNHDAADALFLRLLARTKADPQTDANDVLLLSSYAVSPDLLVLVNDDGSPSFRTITYAPDDDGDVRQIAVTKVAGDSFYSVAADVLLRPGIPSTGAAWQRDAPARYFAVGHLLPFFAREAPQYVAALQARQATLAAEIGDERSARLAQQAQTRRLSSTNPTDPLGSQLDELSRSRDTEKRDRLRFGALETATRRRLWDRARHIADEIENAELRHSALVLLASRQVLSTPQAFADERNLHKLERAAAFVRDADVSSAVRAIGLAGISELFARNRRRARAVELLNEAVSFAGLLTQGTGGRALVFIALTDTAARIDAARTWELLSIAVSAENASAESTDELDDALDFGVKLPENFRSVTLLESPVSFDKLFAAMARLDFARALDEAHGLKSDSQRALVSIAAARAVLDVAGRSSGGNHH